MSFPNTPSTTKSRTTRTVLLVVAAVLVAAGVTVGIMYAVLGRGDGSDVPATRSSPVADGIARPDASCVRTDGTDHQDYWNGNGWWAGRVDGTPKEMPALSVLSLKLNGRQINSVWICAPRPNG